MLPTKTGTPPAGVVYQSAVSPAPTFTIKAGVAVPSQITGKFGPLGGMIGGQLQFGATTICCWLQPVTVLVTVKVTSMPTGMPVMLKLVPLPETVPRVEVKVLALEVALME